MRHDFHFVEELSSPGEGETFGRMIDLEMLDVNPHQPRKFIGDLEDLVSSIKEKGLLEPVLVRRIDDRYQIIAGERRYHASKAAGLSQIPCIEMEVDERGVLEISLIENLQRRDLTPFEEADAVEYLCEKFSYTHEKVAQKLGKSRSSITELLGLAAIPEEVREVCRRADISSKSLLVEVGRQSSVEEMIKLVELIADKGLSRDQARRMKGADLDAPPAAEPPSEAQEAPAAAPRRSSFRFTSEHHRVSVNLRFDRPDVRREEIIAALKDLIQEIESSDELPR